MYPQAGLELLAFLLLVRDSKYIPPHWAFLRTVLFYLIPPPSPPCSFSLYGSGSPGNPYVNQAGMELIEIRLPLPHECSD